MYKEPFFLYFIRVLAVFAILGFMAMLYWSSLLLEEDLQSVKADLNAIKQQLSVLKTWKSGPAAKESTHEKMAMRQHMRPDLPNLLTEDIFYSETLPKMLGADFKPHGTRRQSTIGKPDSLHPFSNWAQVQDWIGLCTVSLSRNLMGKYETYAPDVALKIEGRPVEGSESPEYWIHLREGVFWQPLDPSLLPGSVKLAPHFLQKHPLTAHDFKLFFDIIMNPFISEPRAVALRLYYGDLEEFRVIDDLTFVVRWKSYPVKGEDGKDHNLNKYLAKNLTFTLTPVASFVYKYFADGKKIIEDDNEETYRTNSIWAQNFTTHWAKNTIPSCGPWIFQGMTERVVSFSRNPDHYFPLDALAENLQIEIKESPDNAWQEFKAGGLDFFVLQPDLVLELDNFLSSAAYKEQEKKGLAVRKLNYVARSFSYLAWNEARPLFASKNVRKALTYAIDRERIVRQYINGLGIETTGTFYRYSPNYDDSIHPLPYDPEEAKRILEEEGWYDREGQGVISKVIDGKVVPFEFTLKYYAKSALNKSIADYIATSLKAIGIRCNPQGIDVADLSAMFDDKNFDAYMLAWMLGDPPEDPRQIWYSSGAKEKGSSNSIGFANPEIDKLIDALTYEYDPQKRLELYHKFDKILYDEMPYTFLYTPKAVFLYREYLENVFIPAERQDLIPGANMAEPVQSLFWLRRK